MSIKYKIAFLFAGLVMLIMILASLAVYFFNAKYREINFQKRLKNRALSTARVYAGIGDNNFSLLQKMDTVGVASLFNKSITIVGSGYSHVYMFSDKKNDSLFLERNIIASTLSENERYFDYNHKKAVAIRYHGGGNDFIVAVAASDIDGHETLVVLKKVLLMAVALAAILSFFTGLLFAKKIIRPIKRISGEVNLITTSNISQRIKITAAKDELTELAHTFNQLLDRLQDSFTTQRRFISNASHELSTPLTSISSQLEVAMQKKRTEKEYTEVIQSVHEDIRELQHLTRSLLDIAKTGSQGSIDLSRIRIDEILFKVMSDVQKQNTGFRVSFDFEGFPEDEELLTVFGNGDLLYIALKNIIENGCKYSFDHLSGVTTRFDKTSIFINVSNKGDVIEESDIQNIFQPFFRTASAQNKPGFGLGLTLTRRILALHKGQLQVASDIEKGTVFSMQIPNVSSKF